MPHIHELKDFTCSAFILHPTEPKLLFLKHIKIGKWLQPGGHVELHENPLQTLHHELEEETGLRPDDYEILEPAESPTPGGNNTKLPLPFYFNEHPFNATHNHIDICYLVRAKTDHITDFPDGASDIRWLTVSEIAQLHASNEMFKDTYDIAMWIFNNKIGPA